MATVQPPVPSSRNGRRPGTGRAGRPVRPPPGPGPPQAAIQTQRRKARKTESTEKRASPRPCPHRASGPARRVRRKPAAGKNPSVTSFFLAFLLCVEIPTTHRHHPCPSPPAPSAPACAAPRRPPVNPFLTPHQLRTARQQRRPPAVPLFEPKPIRRTPVHHS